MRLTGQEADCSGGQLFRRQCGEEARWLGRKKAITFFLAFSSISRYADCGGQVASWLEGKLAWELYGDNE
jgi:hypothetical protein